MPGNPGPGEMTCFREVVERPEEREAGSTTKIESSKLVDALFVYLCQAREVSHLVSC